MEREFFRTLYLYIKNTLYRKHLNIPDAHSFQIKKKERGEEDGAVSQPIT